jgi:hypothetical protein
MQRPRQAHAAHPEVADPAGCAAVSWRAGILLTLTVLLAAPEIAQARSSRPPATPRELLQEPMRFERVHGDDPACQPDCPEWIVAQGKIEKDSAPAFARMIAGLGGRRLPILINSPGGSAPDAMAMGRLIRARHLAVAVARTELGPCGSPAASCGQRFGKAIAFGAVCASACPLLLAGGVERYVSPVAYIGVHQIKVTLWRQLLIRHYEVRYHVVDGRRQEVSRSLIGVSRPPKTTFPGSPDKFDREIGAYLKEMGVGAPLMEDILATPPTELHRLTWQDLTTSKLVTIWIDNASAMRGVGANGLVGLPTSPLPGREALFTAKISWPLALSAAGKTVALQLSFAYRRGGGLIDTVLKTGDPVSGIDADAPGRSFRLALSSGDVEYRLVKPAYGDPVRQGIPLAQFCKLAPRGRIMVERPGGPATGSAASEAAAYPHEPPITADISKVEGMTALFEEACSPLALGTARHA